MRLSQFPAVLAFIFVVLLIAASMAEVGKPDDQNVEEPKAAVTENVSKGVNERKPKTKKPRIGTMGIRQKWTECIDMDVWEAIELIKTARPDLKSVIRVPEGSMVTMDMRMDRVRVFCNTNDIVTRPPRVG